jgi:Glycoside hydrolase family 44
VLNVVAGGAQMMDVVRNRFSICSVLGLLVAPAMPLSAVHAAEQPVRAVQFTVDAAQRQPISRLIYGVNFREGKNWGTNDTSLTTLNRFGGNRLTTFNWETNESNCGNDCGGGFPNDRLLAFDLKDPGEVGGAVRRQIDATFRRGRSAVTVTVPIAGWVAADHQGDTAPAPVAPSPDQPATPGRRFRRSEARNPKGATAHPDTRDDVVYQDDFIKWLETRYPPASRDPARPVLVTLDNEPDLWGGTHVEIRGRTASGGEVLTGFEELVSRTISYGAAVKDVAPNAIVLAPGLSGWFGFQSLSHRRAPDGYSWYIDYFLEKIRLASDAQGRRLVDVLDVHWYPEARNTCGTGETPCWSERIGNDFQPQTRSVIEARLQAPRSLWDSTYVENSWVAKSVPGCSHLDVSRVLAKLAKAVEGQHVSRSDLATACPIRLLPRLKESIARYAPGTKIGVTEYYFGRGGDISGAIAQADVLGIFGREGVYAAALWPSAGIYAYNKPAGACTGDESCATLAYRCLFSAFKAYLDYDGKGGRFGDTALAASTSDVASTSVYASADAADPDRMVLVAINKSDAPVSATLSIRNARAFSSAQAWRVTGGIGSCAGPGASEKVAVAANSAQLTLPAYSISIYRLTH